MNRKVLLGTIFLVGFVVLKFYPVFLQYRLPIPMDIFAGGYWPWRLVDYGYPAGVPIKNPIVSDVVSQLFVWNDLSWSLMKQKLLPLWDRYSLLGYPFYANYHSAIFYPLNLLGLFMDSSIARTLVLFLTNVLAALGMYGYLVYKGRPLRAAVLGGIFFVSAGLMTTDFLFSSGSRAIGFLPFVFWATDLYMDRKKNKYLRSLSLAWMMLYLSGHFQITIYSTAIWFVYVFSRRSKSNSKAKLGIYWLLGVLASSLQLIPTMELLTLSFRTAESYISQVNYGLLPTKHLLTLFWAPDALGNNATGNYFGFWNYRESIGYLGLIPGFFIFVGICKRPKSFFSLLFLFSLVMTFVPVIGKLVYQMNLPLISGSAASRWLFVTVFSGAILVADGFEGFVKEGKSRVLFMFCVAFMGLVIWLGVEKMVYRYSNIDLSHEQYFKNNMVTIRNMAIPILNMMVLSIGALVLAANRRRFGTMIGLILIGFICLDFLRFHFKFNSFIETTIAPQNYDLRSKISAEKRLSATSDETFPPNSSTMLRMPSVLGYDPLYPLKNGVYLNAMNGDSNPEHVSRYFNKTTNTKSKLLDYASVGYLATLTRDKTGILSDKGEIPYFIDRGKWLEGYREREMLILHNDDALPLFYVAQDIKNLDWTKHLDEMNSSDNLITFIDGIEVNDLGRTAEVKYKIFENGNAEVEIDSDKQNYLVYNQAAYPGWEASVDGTPTKIYSTNYLFQGIIVPSGRHKITWSFRPKSFYFGCFVSILSLLVISLYKNEQKIGRVS